MRTVKYNDRSNCSTLFCIFPSRCFARLHETSRNFVVSRFHQMSENLTLDQTEVFQFAKSGATSSSLVKLEQENQEWLTQFETSVNSVVC